ncbi:hypothetical protein GCM10012284_25480 [Mangrovihabitans endophyticus]|uniref:Uncharacterized protein n=1 Tax=Mangrovihabitans endophyticus TaxID=1751298 RepID=A0A8J3BZU3_9ACTN|nr:hypothetical protein GCM10012284_25480 [Mangrovihabitans endophyticus]
MLNTVTSRDPYALTAHRETPAGCVRTGSRRSAAPHARAEEDRAAGQHVFGAAGYGVAKPRV